MLPTFIGIGGMKCGTTFAYRIFDELVPEIFVSKTKEIHYFNQNYNRGQDWYEEFFEGSENYGIRGEFTPFYISYPYIADRIKHDIPDVKIIAMLRNPVDRSFSQYSHIKRWSGKRGHKIGSYEEEILQAHRRVIKHPEMDVEYMGPEYYHIKNSMYHEQLVPYFKAFDRKNIHVVIYEELRDNPLWEMNKMIRFLGGTTIIEKEEIWTSKNNEVISEQTREFLQPIFSSEIENLEKLLKRDLSIWKM